MKVEGKANFLAKAGEICGMVMMIMMTLNYENLPRPHDLEYYIFRGTHICMLG